MRNVDSVAAAVAVISVFGLGCVLGVALVSPPGSALGKARNLMEAQSAVCALCTLLRCALGRVAPVAAPRVALGAAVAGWGLTLPLFGWPSGPAAVVFAPLWFVAFVSTGDALCGRAARVGDDMWGGGTGEGCAGARGAGCAGATGRCGACAGSGRVGAVGRFRAARPEAEAGAAVADAPGDFEIACANLEWECRLSRREAEVLRYAARGHRPGFIAGRIGTTEATVRSHMRNIYRKTGLASSEQLIEEVETRAASMRRARLDRCAGRRGLLGCILRREDGGCR